MAEGTQQSGGIMANRRDVLRTAGGLAVATALAGALFEANTETASAQKSGTNTITGTLEGLSGGPVSFEVLAFSFGVNNSGSAGVGGGAGAGKANFQDISITKYLDATTPLIFGAVASGQHLRNATFVASGAKGAEVAKIEIEEVLITSQSFGGSGGDTNAYTENVSFNYARIAITVGGVTETWNVAGNESE